MSDATNRLKYFLRSCVDEFGGYGLFHRLKNGDRLTVAMFHRVLPDADPRYGESDPAYTVSLAAFVDYLAFFDRNYSVIDLQQLRGGDELPPRPLLITFDDGWADTVEFAIPALAARGWSSVVFVAGAAVGSAQPFWQEALIGAVRSGRLQPETLRAALEEFLADGRVALPQSSPLAAARAAVAKLERCDWTEAADFVFRLVPSPANGARAMADASELAAVAASGTAIGAHGFSHVPVTRIDLEEELARCGDVLGPIAARSPSGSLDSFSFPHGVHDAAAEEILRSAGYRYLFTSDPLLHPRRGKGVEEGLIGRIAVGGETALGLSGTPSDAERANWFFNR